MAPASPLQASDEWLHAVPDGMDPRTWADTLWVDVNDPGAGISGIVHWHMGFGGVARIQVNVVIDGMLLNHVNKFPFEASAGAREWGDGRLTYRVTEPLHEIAVSFDGPRFGLDLVYRRRFPFDPVFRPLLAMGAQTVDGGHYEQPMTCEGTLELRDGPRRGEVRPIACNAFRDHSWSDRWSKALPWEGHVGATRYGHYWPAFYLPDRHIQGWGMHTPDPSIPGTVRGGFVTSADGQHLLQDSCVAYTAAPEDWRRVERFAFELTMPDGEILHLTSGRSFGLVRTYHLDLFNDVEARVDQYANFCEVAIAETGERGVGTLEYSVIPAVNRWLT
jgi:hypothetical protein